LKLARRCVAPRRARVAFGGDTADVRSVTFRYRGVRRLDGRAPFAVTLSRAARVSAVVEDFDGSRSTLRRTIRRCRG
jgi:hypothetical protein